MTTIFFSPLSFVAVFGSGIRDPGWVKIRIRDKHPGSATLLLTGALSKSGKHINDQHHCPIPVFMLTASKLEAYLEIQRYGLCA